MVGIIYWFWKDGWGGWMVCCRYYCVVVSRGGVWVVKVMSGKGNKCAIRC